MPASNPPVIVHVKHTCSASAEQVFDAWLDPTLAKKFFFTTTTGEMLKFELDPKVGGEFTVMERRPKDDAGGKHGSQSGTHDVRYTGQYAELARPHRLLFSFSVLQHGPDETTVTLDILPLSSGGCELRLTHGLGSGGAARTGEAGDIADWEKMLQRMDKALESSRAMP